MELSQAIRRSATALLALGLLAGALVTADALGQGDAPPGAGLGDNLRPLEARAREFAEDGRVLKALHELPGPELPREVKADPERYLASQDIKLPEGLDLRFSTFPGPKKVAPDFEFFSIRQFDCRSYYLWTNDDDGEGRHIETVEICRGFEIVPKHVSPIG